MLNRDIYNTAPKENRLANNGVAEVSEDHSAAAQDILRYELETFVCDGQYEKGLETILDKFLLNLDAGSEQPGTYILTSLSGEIYIVLTGRLAPPEGETIKLSDIRKTSMEWIHEGTNGGEFLVDGKWAKATKVIITLTFVKV